MGGNFENALSDPIEMRDMSHIEGQIESDYLCGRWAGIYTPTIIIFHASQTVLYKISFVIDEKHYSDTSDVVLYKQIC